MLRPYRYIVVDGPCGIGKTALAKRLADCSGKRFLADEPTENPFLPRFYQEPARYALPTQLSFLIQRIRKLEPIVQHDLFEQGIVTDFLLEKDNLYAELMLSSEELPLYQMMYQKLAPALPKPDLVISLQASPNWLVEHVRKIAYPHVPDLQDGLLRRVAQRYSSFFYGYGAAPVLMVNVEHMDLESETDFALLLRRVNNMRGTREFFNKGD
ncbi:deoxynucleoside kinase [Leeia sp. TBRC 13508]|uniref:Deoxynucleoside kinase n=1 Tax=Leeia speluncae TaxID=2884804 RepID=A0ABS8D7G2_9NEIS|nr:deoxynucleoside kinase [Leeia speluncae]MCB6184135.1 deoxynucleoside kinase [Leeia speluncae]